MERPNGMIITTGPTGSGKTTTLYSILRTLNKPGVKIITLEDPVEIKMEGINQSQVDTSRDYTLPKACAPFCARTRTFVWWAKFAIWKPRKLPFKRR